MSRPANAKRLPAPPSAYDLALAQLRNLPQGKQLVYSTEEFSRTPWWDAARKALAEGHVTLTSQRVDGELHRIAIGLRRETA